MIKRDDIDIAVRSFPFVRFAVRFADGFELEVEIEFLHDITHGVTAERGDYARLYDLYLAVEEWTVNVDLALQWIAVLRRAVFDDVSNVNRGARDST